MTKTKKRILTGFMSGLFCIAAQAATTNTTMTVQGTASIGASGIGVSGTANFTGGIGNGTFNTTLSLTSLDPTKQTVDIPLPISISGSTLNLTVTLPTALLL